MDMLIGQSGKGNQFRQFLKTMNCNNDNDNLCDMNVNVMIYLYSTHYNFSIGAYFEIINLNNNAYDVNIFMRNLQN